MPTTAPSRRFIILDDSTVREARDRQEEKRPNKRARVDDSDDKDSSKTSCENQNSKGPYERDPVYFKEDASANCVVRVRGWMFRVSSYSTSSSFECPSVADGITTRYKPICFLAVLQ